MKKRNPRKLALSRETLRLLKAPSLSHARGGWSDENCTDICDTDYECSSACDQATNIYYVCSLAPC
jgi:hypothetical protein